MDKMVDALSATSNNNHRGEQMMVSFKRVTVEKPSVWAGGQDTEQKV